jgi:hypothetical protein
MPQIPPPVEIMTHLADYCKENSLGMGSAWGDGFGIILIGMNNDSPDRIALLCAQALIEGILNGAWMKTNEIVNSDAPFIVPEPSRSQ